MIAVRQPCTGGEPPFCCQPPMTPAEIEAREDRLRRVRAAFVAEIPERCPWLGHRDVVPVFATDRRTWGCLDCRREFTTGV